MLLWAIGAGALLGLGIFLLIWQLMPATPVAGRALRRLHPVGRDTTVLGGISPSRPWWERLWRPPTRELTLLGRTPQQYWLSNGLSALRSEERRVGKGGR